MTEPYPFFGTCVDNKAYLSSDSRGHAVAPRAGETLSLLITVGKTYQILGEKLGMYIVVNNMGSTSLHPKGQFSRVLDSQP